MAQLKKVWLNLLLAPIWFLLVIFIFSVYYSVKGLGSLEIATVIAEKTSIILLVIQLLLLFQLLIVAKKESFNLFSSLTLPSKNLKIDLFKGILLGSIIAISYLFILSPLQYQLQLRVGDIVPPGETMNALGSQLIPFFIANVLLAPFIEESLYRNYALTTFKTKFSSTVSILLSALMFGLLHWSGGIWYVLMTALVLGLPFGIIAARRNTIFLVFIAHFTLNLIEFLYIALN